MMVIYEVNLLVNESIYADFQIWLQQHVREMLQHPGFIRAYIFNEEQHDGDEKQKLTIQYQLMSRRDLDHYFEAYASNMLEEGVKRFGNSYSATRRIFDDVQFITK
jgi:uncharacterized NAD(P)/FAD-binding protein YdhS